MTMPRVLCSIFLVVAISAGVALHAVDAAGLLRQGQYQAVLNEDGVNSELRMRALLALGDYQAIIDLELAETAWPLLAIRAEALYRSGQRKAHQALIARARQASAEAQWKQNPAALTAMASIIGEHDIQLAWRLVNDVHHLDKQFLEAYVVGARICIAAFAWQYALGESKIASAIDKQDARVLSLAARAFISDNKFSQAHALLDQALELNPFLTDALNLKALLALQQRDDQDMLGFLERAQAINARHSETLALLAAAAELSSDTALRDQHIKTALSLNPHAHELFALLAESAERRYRYEEALAWGRRAQQVHPEHWQGDYIVAVNLLRLGEEPEGYQLMDQAFKKNKFNIWAYNMLTVLDEDFKHGDYKLHHSKYFSVKIPNSIDASLWFYLERWLDPMYEAMAQRYQYQARGPKAYEGRILILFFDQHGKFSARTAGLPGLGARGATFGQVVTMPMTDEDNIDAMHPWFSTLEHEIAHVFTIQKTKRRIPRWFTEGISEWQEGEPHVELDALLVETFHREAFPLIQDLSNGIHYPKFPGQVPLTYFISSLCIEYLVDKHGVPFLNAVLDDLAADKDLYQSLAVHSGQSLEELNTEIQAYARSSMARSYVQRGMDKETYERKKAAHAQNPFSGQALHDLATGAIQQGELNLAQTYIETLAADAEWEDASLVLQAQISLRFARNPAEAIDVLSQVLAVDDSHVPANFWAMRAAMQLRDDTSIELHALPLLEHMPRLTRGPNNPYRQLIRIYTEQGQYDELVEILQKQLAVDPFNFRAQRAYALELFRREQWQSASDELERSLQFSMYDARLHSCFGYCQEQLGHDQVAMAAYRIALSLDETQEVAAQGLNRLQKD